MVAPNPQQPAKERYIGPPAPPDAVCWECGRHAVATCESCALTYCETHWLHHSHRTLPLPPGWTGGPLRSESFPRLAIYGAVEVAP